MSFARSQFQVDHDQRCPLCREMVPAGTLHDCYLPGWQPAPQLCRNAECPVSPACEHGQCQGVSHGS